MKVIDDEQPTPVTDRPPYVVPLMTEIAALPWNGYNVVSTFSGCGGSCLGFKMAGYRVLWASEFVPAAQETYRANHDGTILDTRDIRSVEASEILDAIGLCPGELDVFEGSPPCSAFSTAGKREAGWGEAKSYSDGKVQVVDDLFFEYARLLEGLQPRVFVAENVSGLVKGTAKGYFKEILARLTACGYQVEARLLDAQWLGVPQARQRLIFMGTRNDLPIAPMFPTPFPYRYTIRDALGDGLNVEHDTRGTFSVGELHDRPVNTITTCAQHWRVSDVVMRRGSNAPRRTMSLDEPSLTVAAHGMSNVGAHQCGVMAPGTTDPETGESLKVSDYVWADDGRAYDPETGARIDLGGTALAAEFDRASAGLDHRFFNLAPATPNAPIQTVTAAGGGRGTAGVTHYEPRKFTLAELRRLCGFPDDFVLTGTYGQRWERLGRSVPPVMMAQVAATIRDEVLPRCAD